MSRTCTEGVKRVSLGSTISQVCQENVKTTLSRRCQKGIKTCYKGFKTMLSGCQEGVKEARDKKLEESPKRLSRPSCQEGPGDKRM